MECKNKSRNMQLCNCSYTGCEKMGICCDCIKHHRDKGQIPACYFPIDAEKTYDRSINHFIRTQQS